ncbi:MAG TPA: hypothetical protein VLG37_04620 [Candidatus Saccharimonadales bacterium]|nr:hypothetical protein [Candidatus Saccharimonadales bacterium]
MSSTPGEGLSDRGDMSHAYLLPTEAYLASLVVVTIEGFRDEGREIITADNNRAQRFGRVYEQPGFKLGWNLNYGAKREAPEGLNPDRVVVLTESGNMYYIHKGLIINFKAAKEATDLQYGRLVGHAPLVIGQSWEYETAKSRTEGRVVKSDSRVKAIAVDGRDWVVAKQHISKRPKIAEEFFRQVEGELEKKFGYMSLLSPLDREIDSLRMRYGAPAVPEAVEEADAEEVDLEQQPAGEQAISFLRSLLRLKALPDFSQAEAEAFVEEHVFKEYGSLGHHSRAMAFEELCDEVRMYMGGTRPANIADAKHEIPSNINYRRNQLVKRLLGIDPDVVAEAAKAWQERFENFLAERRALRENQPNTGTVQPTQDPS